MSAIIFIVEPAVDYVEVGDAGIISAVKKIIQLEERRY